MLAIVLANLYLSLHPLERKYEISLFTEDFLATIKYEFLSFIFRTFAHKIEVCTLSGKSGV